MQGGPYLLVVDIDDVALTQSELAALREDRKIILSYLSIGEAEDYRDYWQDGWEAGNPSFIDHENPEWEGNFKVKYWMQEWQTIIDSRVAEIAEAGYDGVYLDIIDAYEYYEESDRVDAAEEMVEFVSSIRDKGRSQNPDFLIIAALELRRAPERGIEYTRAHRVQTPECFLMLQMN